MMRAQGSVLCGTAFFHSLLFKSHDDLANLGVARNASAELRVGPEPIRNVEGVRTARPHDGGLALHPPGDEATGLL